MIVPAHNAAATLGRTLAALAEQDIDADYEVIVVDDGSSDGTAVLARAAGNWVTVISQPASGPGTARNAGVSHARGAALAFCDADVFPTPGWLRAGLRCLESADLVQGRVLPDPQVALGPFDRTIWVTRGGGLWEAANLFVRPSLFLALGGFEDWLKPAEGKPLAEDVLFGYRAERSAARCVFCEDALAHHAVFPRRWYEYIAERRRLQYFPAIVRAAPELRHRFLYRDLFLDARSARFDLALAGALVGGALRSPLPLAAAGPYLLALRGNCRRGRRGGAASAHVAAADFAADALGLLSLAEGSIRYRRPIL